MNSPASFRSRSSLRGSALVTVMGFCLILLVLISSVMQYSGTERKLNNRSKLHLEARLAAEAISEYGIAQAKHLLETDRAFTNGSWSSTLETMFVPGGSLAAGGGAIGSPPDTFWDNTHIVKSTGASAQTPTLHVGKLLDPDSGGLYYVDPTNPDNYSDPLKGKRVFRYNLDVLSRATASAPAAGGTVVNFMKQTFSIRAALFSNAVYYNMDLELGAGADMVITGSTHANGRMFIRPAWSAKVQFAGPVTAVKGFWTHYSGSPLMPYFQIYNNNNGTTPTDNSSSTATVEILPGGSIAFDSTKDTLKIAAATTGYATNLAANTWVDSTWNKATTSHTWQAHLGEGDVDSIETDATRENYTNWIQQRFKGNLLTHVNGILPVKLQGIPDYNYVYGSSYPDTKNGKGDGTLTTDVNSAAYTYGITGANDPLNAAHSLIEPPLKTTDNSYYEPTERIKYSRNAGLYILVNTTATSRWGHKPDGTRTQVKGVSYRAFLNDGTEVLLPGQDFYGNNNATPNPYNGTSGTPNLKDAMPLVTLFNVNYNAGTNFGKEQAGRRRMWDYRRSDGAYYPGKTTDSPTRTPTYRSTATNYTFAGKLIDLIDVDMTELKKTVKAINLDVGSTSTAYSGFYLTGLPPTTTWSSNKFIYRDSAPATVTPTLGNTNQIVLAPAAAADPFTKAFIKPSSGVQTNWNGAVYIESIAAQLFDTSGTTSAADAATRHRLTRNLRNSGVRLLNGRGKAPSIDDVQGFSIITNDTAYILGHFNADGLASTPSVSGSNVKNTPDAPGGSTGQYPDDATTSDVSASTELPVSVVADAITLLSQPVFDSATNQSDGWNDAMSENAISSDNYSTSWATTTSAGGNQRDGNRTSRKLYKVPYDSDVSVNGEIGAAISVKLQPAFTEYSCAMLMGLVPTGKDNIAQNSGGLNNFPRFLEEWSTVYKDTAGTAGSAQTARIRGAFVALFECRVGTEPWNGRAYGAPNRDWGFNLIFAEGRMPPLTPKVLHFRRSGAIDITKAEYNDKLSDWGYSALP